MRNILLVDDDPRILQLYQDRLVQLGLQVSTAADGLAAIQALQTHKPDLVVLDLMMPRLTGVDVLKFIRSQPNLKALPVVVLSNSYMNELAGEAAGLGVQKALLKIRCSPSILLETIEDVLAGRTGGNDTSSLLAAPRPVPAAPKTPAPTAAPASASPAPALEELIHTAAEFHAKARRTFLENAGITCAELRRLCQTLVTAQKESERRLRLQDLGRKIHFVAAAAGLAECRNLAQMTSALEAMLFELNANPMAATPSAMHTVAATIDFIVTLFDSAREGEPDLPASVQALLMDDDALNNRLVVTALQRAQIQVHSTPDPAAGLELVAKTHFDLVLLDVEMPGMDGFEFCRRLRKLPGYESVAVIFVTHHSDFASRAQSALSGGNDLIAKPIFPMELAVKAVAHLLKRQIGAT